MLVGVSGHTVMSRAIFEWAETGFDEKRMPENQKTDKYNPVICIVRDDEKGHRVYFYENSPVPWLNEQPWATLGAGADLAGGALEMDADAVKAVEVAIKHSPVCGMGIDALSFED